MKKLVMYSCNTNETLVEVWENEEIEDEFIFPAPCASCVTRILSAISIATQHLDEIHFYPLKGQSNARQSTTR